MKKCKVIISGGGTGGHIFPAIAIANAIKEKNSEAEILFIGAKGRMEMEKVPAAGYEIKGLWISGLQRKLTFKNVLFPIKVICSLFKAAWLIRQFKPDVVIGVGGYASGPTLRMAALQKVPTLIQEQNSFPGMTNRMLAKKVMKICVAYQGMEKFFPAEKIVFTGNPVRQDIAQLENKRVEGLKYFNLSADKKIVLVVGGSLGALSINQGVMQILNKCIEKDIQLIWQTGKSFYPLAEEAVNKFNNPLLKVFPFITKMDFAYATADVIVSRAGAIAISELCLIQKPAILVPSPNVTDDHQTKNALSLSSQNAAILLPNADVNQKLSEVLFNLVDNSNLQASLSKNISLLAKPEAANDIADCVFSLIPEKRWN
jgi:UDP-N-acetylglucosamine--N-acetylmuramyl-(pentapeptide) pyrophosphoryl-undecaprenol N-acetylglucosamine transferase